MAILGSLNPLNGVIWVGSLHQKRTKSIIEVKVSKIFRLRMELHHEVAPEEQQQNAKIQPLWVPTTPAKPAPAPIPFDLGNGQEYRVSTNPICPETKRMATRTSGGLSQESATQDGLSTGGHKSRPSTLTYDTAEQGWRLTPGTKPTELNDMEAVRSNPFLKLLLQSQIGDGQSSSVRPNQILPTNPILSTEITASVGVVDAMPSTPARETMEKNKNMQECLDHEVTNLVPESNRGKTLMNLCFSGDMVSTNYKSVVSSSSPDFAIPSHILPSIGEENEARAVILTEEDVQPLSVEKPDVANQGIDLNRTPQQKVKRKKHRPKVIREGKPVRTPKPKTPKPVTPKVAMLSKESTIGKRKYVRKKIGQSSSSADSKVLVERSDTDNKNSRSVRRRLDFNLEAVEVRYACPETFMESMHSTQSQTLAFHLQRSINGSSTMTTIQHAGVAENPRPGMPFYLNGSATQVPNEYIRSSEVQNPSPKPCAEKLITNEITFHSESIPTNFGTQSYKRKLAYDKLSEIANSNNCFKKATTAAMYQETSEIQSDSNLMSFLMFNQAKRDAISQDSRTTNYSNSVCAFGGINQLAQPNEFPPMSGHDLYLSEKPKKKGTRKKQDFTSNSSLEAVYISPSKQGANHLVMKNDVTALEQKQGSEHIFAFDKIDSRRSELAALNLESNSISSSSGFSHRTATLDSHQFSSAVKTFTNSDLEVSEILETQKVNDLVRINSNRKPERRKTKGQGQLPNTDLAGSQGHVNIIFSSNVVSSTQKIPDSVVVRTGGERGNVFLPRIDSKCESDSSHLIPACSNLMSITPNVENLLENIIEKIRHITISEIHKDARGIAETALVPFYGGGVIVPYKGLFDFAKKRQPRPKVDLDAETARVWNLLMGKGGNDSVDEDSEKEKRWDEERKVFHGRVESFIARMHLVQGDRRFSKWKGSVVDSVVGVFLTQNVSDHLSSSAFMALAARFPSKLRANNEESYQEKNEIHTEVQNNCIASLDDCGNLQEHISSKEVDHLGSQQNTGENESSNSNESFSCETRGNMSGYFVKCVGTHENAFGYESTQNSLCIPVRINGNTTEAEVENRLSFDDVASSSVVSSENSSGNQAKATNWTELNLQPDFQYEDFVTGSISNGLGFATSFVELLHMAERIPSKSFQDGVGCLGYSIPQKKTSTLDPWCNLGISTTSSGPCFNKYSLVDRLSENAVSLSDGSGMTNTNRDKLFDASNSPPLLTVNQNILQQNLPLVHENKFEDGSCAQNKHILQPESRSQTEACMTKQSFCRYNFQNDEKEASTSISVNQMCCQALDKDKIEIQQKDNTKFLPESTDIIQTDLRNLSNQQNFLNLGNKPKNLLEVFQGVESSLQNEACNSHRVLAETTKNVLEGKKVKAGKDRKETYDWDILRREVNKNGTGQERNLDTMDSLDWEAIRCADVKEIADAIKERGMNNRLAERIKDFLDRLVKDHGSIDLEWLREIEPDKAKDYLLSIRGLGLKSVECVRLLTLQHLAFPVDTNVGRICVRLGWVPLQPLPESLQLHLLELYPVQETVQKYLWPRLCKLDQRTLYELHYQLITFGKVFCTKNKPNCNSCPMRAECKHFASAFASARLALPGPEEKRLVSSAETGACEVYTSDFHQIEDNQDSKERNCCNSCEPIIEEPSTPEIKQIDIEESTIEGIFYEDPDEIPTIKLDFEEFTQNLHNYMQEHNLEVKDGDMSKALVVLNPEAASIPMPKLKNVSLLRTEHHVYELPDSHPLLEGLDQREPDDPSSYLLAIWTPGETAQSVEPPEAFCNSQETGKLCEKTTCFACNSVRESEAQTVRGTILIPCRTAMKGRFPLNGTYFQVNEVFADHNTSCNPINVPREWIWNLPRRTVYFGTSIPTIFKGLTTQEIQQCFWRGFVCVRGYDRTTRAPKPLYARLHFPASKAAKNKKSPAAEARKTEARGGRPTYSSLKQVSRNRQLLRASCLVLFHTENFGRNIKKISKWRFMSSE